jgi:hypothetical protein
MKQFGGSWTLLSGAPPDVTFEATILKTLWDIGDGGKKRVSKKKKKEERKKKERK